MLSLIVAADVSLEPGSVSTAVAAFRDPGGAHQIAKAPAAQPAGRGYPVIGLVVD